MSLRAANPSVCSACAPGSFLSPVLAMPLLLEHLAAVFGARDEDLVEAPCSSRCRNWCLARSMNRRWVSFGGTAFDVKAGLRGAEHAGEVTSLRLSRSQDRSRIVRSAHLGNSPALGLVGALSHVGHGAAAQRLGLGVRPQPADRVRPVALPQPFGPTSPSFGSNTTSSLGEALEPTIRVLLDTRFSLRGRRFPARHPGHSRKIRPGINLVVRLGRRRALPINGIVLIKQYPLSPTVDSRIMFIASRAAQRKRHR